MTARPPLIAHIIYRLDFGGLENGLVNLVNRMPPERYRHVIVCLAGSNPTFRQRIERADVEVLSLDKKPGKDLGMYLRAWRVLRRLRPDIVHTRNLGTVDLQWIAATAGTAHRVHGEHGWEATDPRGLAPRGLRIRRACRPAISRYISVSRDIAHWLEQYVGVPPARIDQVYNGVDVAKFHPAHPVEARVASNDGDVVSIGTIGRLDPVKNHVALLQAFAALRARQPRLRLTIVGDGQLRDELESHAAALGIDDDVMFSGARSQVPELMRHFDVFVLPSINEGISNTILEAMASGLPVVASRVGGNPEVVVDGVTGRLYEPSDSAGLEQALLPYVADPLLRQAHGRAGRQRVVQNFSLDSMVDRYVAIYDELLGT